MLSFVVGLVGLVGLVAAQDSNSTFIDSSTSTSATSTGKATVLTVGPSAAFTAINAAISAAQNSAIPTVSVLAGTYSEPITIQGTQTVTIAGPSASNVAGNQVVIAAAPTGGVVSFNTQKSSGVVFKNLNITNTISTATSKAPAVSLVGANMALYNVALVSGGTGVYTSSLGSTLLSGCYIEGPDKLFYNYVRAYVYNSIIVPTASSASIFYGQGYLANGVYYNSSIVVDSSTVQQKAGLSNTYVYLAQPNGNNTEAIYRGNSLGSMIAPTGVRATVCIYAAVYGEYQNTGTGAMTSSNAATRNAACDQSLTVSQLSSYSIDQFFGNGYAGYSSFDTTWIDATVLKAISSSDSAQVASASTVASSSTSSASSTSSSAVPTTTSVAVLSSVSVSTTTNVTDSTVASTTSVSATSSLAAASVLTVATASAQFTDIGAAVSAAQNSGIASVTVLPGTYSAFVVTGTQAVVIVGPAASSVAGNQVVVTSSGTAGSVSFGTSNGKGLTLRNMNLTNTATTGTGPAISAKGVNVQILTCALVSSTQAVYSASYGTTLIANSLIQGTDKLFYNYPTVYLYGSTIVPTTSGSSIFYGKGATIGGVNYNATLIADSSSIQGSASNVYLATPNGANNYVNVVYRNSVLSSAIAAGGVYSTGCSIVATFGEFLNTGAGSYASNAASRGAATCDYQLSADQVSAFTIDKVFANAFSGYGSSDLSWVDASVLSSIQSSDAAQVSSASAIAATATASSTSATGSATATCATPTPSATLIVSQNATADSCQYGNISLAIAALPNDSKPYTILVKAGTYNEMISITRNGKVTLIGETDTASDYKQNKVTVQFSNGQLTSAGKDETTMVLNVKKTGSAPDFAVYNIDFINLYPQTTNTAALALDVYGSNFAAYGCSFIGYQDTLLVNKGTQVFSGCYIEGSIDFVWGFSTAYFYRSVIASNTKGACNAAQGRVAGTTSGYVFDDCYVTYTSAYGSTFGASYLGRPYSNYSTVVYKNSYLDQHINAAGWNVWSNSNPQTSNVIFGEYNNTGPGAWTSSRATFAVNFNDAQVAPYSLSSWIGDTSFIDQAAWNYPAPFNVSATATSSTGTTTTGTGSTSTATINAHPDSGTVPPQYAVLVSSNGEVNGSYPNVTAALASLPNDNTNQTIFVYSGTYTEQLPAINRPGAVRVIGYTTGNPGQAYQNSTVNVQFARGLSVSPLPSGHSDAETAVVSTASNNIAFYNIVFVNTDNLDGSEASYVTLATSLYGTHISFYACSFDGWQDTMLNGATNGYQYFESCYIGGAIDFIWGYSKAYFKGCTIGAKRASSAITAHSRASSSAIGGYIFDQCYFGASPKATVDLTNKVFLGRPYSQYALVVVKNSYIDSAISPTGWKIWSATDPRTDHITFAEYNNIGPSNWENNVAARTAFGNATLLTSDTYPLSSVMDSTSWIDMTYWNTISTPQPAAPAPAGNVTVSGSSVYNGTVPPTGAIVVSKSPIQGQTVYATIQEALNVAPTSSKTNATIFIYPGTYNEQLIVNKSGSTIFMGYSDATDDYSKNQVTIQQSYGEDTQGDGSDVDAATVYATGNYFYAYNVNFRNNNGTQQNIASLGFAVKSSKFAYMHGCQIYGNQDTLYISGNMFTFKTYIEGNIDFIFGAGSGYFLNSTIAVNEEGDSITAHKRAANTTNTAFVFDQSSVVPATGVDASSWKNVSLGRPWNNLARVAYIDCYLDKMIGAAGWDQWSKSSPQTDGVTYGEYHNYGPGSSTCGRASFSRQLSDADVVQFQIQNIFPSTSWIDFSTVDVNPFVPGIGSAPACAISSSTIVSSTSTRSSSIISSSTISSSTVLTTSSSVPIVTVYVTKFSTDKEIAYTTVSVGDVTSTSTVVVTEDHGVTATPAPVLKTSVIKGTTTISSVVTQAPSTVTIRSTETDLSTVTQVGKVSTVKSTEYTTTTSTYVPNASVIKATTTIVVVSTVTPKAMTITNNQGTISTVYVTKTQKGATTTSTVSLSGAVVIKTTSLKGSTSKVSVTQIAKTTTKKTTVTCDPAATQAARLFRRGIEARAAGTVTSTISAIVTAYTKTSTISQLGSTYYTTVTSTSTLSGAATLKSVTSTVFSTSYKTITALSTESGSVATVSSIVTKSSATTITQAASIQTSVVTSTQAVVETQEGTVSTSYKIVSSTSYTTLPAQTVTAVNNANSYTTITTTLPASTSTVFKTASAQATTSTVTAAASVVTQTTTIKATSTVYSTATKSKAGAAACTA